MIARRNKAAALVTSAVGAVGTAIAGATGGGDAAWSAVLGLVLVVVFLSAGSLPLALVDERMHKGFAFLVLGMTYVLRILLGVVIYAVATSSAHLERRVIGLSVIACALAWTAVHVTLGVRKDHAPTLEA